MAKSSRTAPANSAVKKGEDLKGPTSAPKGKEQKVTPKPDNEKGRAADSLHQVSKKEGKK